MLTKNLENKWKKKENKWKEPFKNIPWQMDGGTGPCSEKRMFSMLWMPGCQWQRGDTLGAPPDISSEAPLPTHMRWLVCSISQGHWKSGRHSSLVFKGALAKACHVTHVVKHWPFVLIIASWEKVHMITKSSSKGSQPGFNLWFICCYSGRFISILRLLQRHIFQAIICKLYSASSLSNT